MYGGGGSPSSKSLLPWPSLVSLGSAALVSTRTELAAASRAAGVVGVAASDSSKGGAGPDGGEASAVSECDASDCVTSAQYGSCDDGAGKYLEGKLWAEKGGGDSVAEDGLSWRRAVARTCSRPECESTSSLGAGVGAWPRREGVVCTEEESESTVSVGLLEWREAQQAERVVLFVCMWLEESVSIVIAAWTGEQSWRRVQ